MGLWGWLTGDRSGPPAAGPGSSADGGSAPGGHAGPRQAARPAGGWQALPPIQRTLAGVSPAVRPVEFADSLITWHNPGLVHGLDHGVSPLAPSGLVSGLAEPVTGEVAAPVHTDPGPAPATVRFPRPAAATAPRIVAERTTVQRDVVPTPGEDPPASPDQPPDAAPESRGDLGARPGSAVESAVEPAAPARASIETRPLTTSLPVSLQRLAGPTGAPDSPVRSAGSMVSAPPLDLPRPDLPALAMPAASVSPWVDDEIGGPAAEPPGHEPERIAPLLPGTTAPIGWPSGTATGSVPSTPAGLHGPGPSGGPDGAPRTAAPPTVSRLPAGPDTPPTPRRLGLGAPLADPPRLSPIPVEPPVRTDAAPARGEPPVQRTAAGPAPLAAPPVTPPAPASEPAPRPGTPVDGAPTDGLSGDGATGEAPGPGTATLPLAGATPLVSRLAADPLAGPVVQRTEAEPKLLPDALGAPAAESGPTASPAASPTATWYAPAPEAAAPLLGDRPAPVTVSPAAERLPIGADHQPVPIRWHDPAPPPAPGTGPAGPPASRAGAFGGATARGPLPVVLRSADPGTPSAARGGTIPGLAAASPPDGAGESGHPGSAAPVPVVQATPGGPEVPDVTTHGSETAPVPVVQMAGPAEPGPATSGAGAAAAPANPAAGGAAGASTDELVRRLFDPLAARLKAELRLDRERAGLITDLRR